MTFTLPRWKFLQCRGLWALLGFGPSSPTFVCRHTNKFGWLLVTSDALPSEAVARLKRAWEARAGEEPRDGDRFRLVGDRLIRQR